MAVTLAAVACYCMKGGDDRERANALLTGSVFCQRAATPFELLTDYTTTVVSACVNCALHPWKREKGGADGDGQVKISVLR